MFDPNVIENDDREYEDLERVRKEYRNVIIAYLALIVGLILWTVWIVAEADTTVVYPTYPYTTTRDYGSEKDAYVITGDEVDGYIVVPAVPFTSSPDYTRPEDWYSIGSY